MLFTRIFRATIDNLKYLTLQTYVRYINSDALFGNYSVSYLSIVSFLIVPRFRQILKISNTWSFATVHDNTVDMLREDSSVRQWMFNAPITIYTQARVVPSKVKRVENIFIHVVFTPRKSILSHNVTRLNGVCI